MKKSTVFIAFLILCTLWLFKADTGAGGRYEGKDKPYVTGHIIVKFRSNAPEREKGRVRGLVSGREGRKLKRIGIEKVYIPPGWDEERAVDVLNRNPSVEYAHVDYKVELLDAPTLLAVMPTLVPDDTQFGEQWHLDSIPFDAWFTTSTNPIQVDVDIDAPEAWAVMAGMFDTTMSAAVGVIDSGCGEEGFFSTGSGYIPNHVDLPGSSLFVNTSELPADGLDSTDTNSLIDDANGWDFGDADNIPADLFTSVATYHGTIISGIVGAAWNNAAGAAGIGAGRLEILPLRFGVSFFDVVAAVEYAMDLVEDGYPVRVLNMSFKSNGVDPLGLKPAVEQAQTYGIAVAVAAGNDGGNNDDNRDHVWPAEYTKDPAIANVLAVASTDNTGFLSWFSNMGPSSVQIAAPGESIYSTYGGTDQYATASGTSFSTPIAGAVLGLVMAAHPALSPAEAIDRVVEGGDFDARLAGLVESGKRINMAGALAPFHPFSGLAYLGSTVSISMYTDSISSDYGTIVNVTRDTAWSTTPVAATMTGAPSGTLILTPNAPGIAQFTINFSGASAPVGTYDTGPWRITAIRPFTAQVQVGESVTFTPLMTTAPSWSVTHPTVASINSAGVLTGRAEGRTRVILSDGGIEKDYSGWVLVLPGSGSSTGTKKGGCGTTLPPGDGPWTGIPEMVLIGTILIFLRWRQRAGSWNSKFKIQDSGKEI